VDSPANNTKDQMDSPANNTEDREDQVDSPANNTEDEEDQVDSQGDTKKDDEGSQADSTEDGEKSKDLAAKFPVNTFVVAIYEDDWLVAQVVDKATSGITDWGPAYLHLTYMRKLTGDMLKWPERPDILNTLEVNYFNWFFNIYLFQVLLVVYNRQRVKNSVSSF